MHGFADSNEQGWSKAHQGGETGSDLTVLLGKRVMKIQELEKAERSGKHGGDGNQYGENKIGKFITRVETHLLEAEERFRFHWGGG